MSPVVIVLLSTLAQQWIPQESGTSASLRGVSAVSTNVAWASGTRGTVLRTLDGGTTWRASTVAGAEALDFRDIHAVDDSTAYVLSIGEGDRSRVYKTVDGGTTWSLLLTNPDSPKGFFDQFAFWSPTSAMLMGDPVDGHLVVMTTSDAGKTWIRQKTPPALEGEGAFAASGTGIVTGGAREVWIGTGGPGCARVFHSIDGGKTWTVATTPIRNDSASAGIFSLAFSDKLHGIAVGGDYSKATESKQNIALTSDGGRTWVAPSGTPPRGFRSAVAYVADKKMWIAAGPSGSDSSTDGGINWTGFDEGNYNAISFASGGAGWAVGPRGRIARFAHSRTRK